MNRLNRCFRWGLCAVVIIILCAAYVHRFRIVNQQLQLPPVQTYSLGEEVEMGQDILINYTMEGYSIKVNEAEVLTYEEFLEKYEAEDEYSYVPEKVYDVEVTLRNIDADEETGINVIEYYVQGLAICAGLDTNLWNVANPQLQDIYAISLRENSEMIFHFPFALYKDNFRDNTWNNLDEFDMNFVATLYPAKKVIALR